MPEFFLRQQFDGKAPEQVFSRVGFSGDHSRTIQLVQSGAYEVGVLDYSVWELEKKAGKVDPAQVQVIWETPTYPDYQWTIRGDVDATFGAGFKDKVQAALLALDDPGDLQGVRPLEVHPGQERRLRADRGRRRDDRPHQLNGSAPMGAVFELRQATVGYDGRPVLVDIDLTVERGERVAIMGRSGAGKSTLIKLLFAQRAAEVALIPQAAALVKTLSVFHNVYMGRLDRRSTLHNLRTLIRASRGDLAAVAHVLESVGLAEKLFAAAGTLSGGQQQRTSVARALYNGRPILIGDEPVSALDRVQASEVLSLARRSGTRRSCSYCTTSRSRSATPTASSCWSTAARCSTPRPVRSRRPISSPITGAETCRASPTATPASRSFSPRWCACWRPTLPSPLSTPGPRWRASSAACCAPTCSRSKRGA